MSLIGGNFSPYRQPAGGVPWFCGEYKNAIAAVVAEKFVNSTTVNNPAGGAVVVPYERYTAGGTCGNTNCESGSTNVCADWQGTDLTPATEQFSLVAGQPNVAPQSFAPSGTVDLTVCHKRGFKAIAAKKWWHGVFPWTSEAAACSDTWCSTQINDCNGNTPGSTGYFPTYQLTGYQSYQANPDHTKYLACASDIYYQAVDTTTSSIVTITAGATGAATINAQSGETTSTLLTTETDVCTPVSGSCAGFTPKNISGGHDSISNTDGNATIIDYAVGADVHCNNMTLPGGTTSEDFMASFNANICSALTSGTVVSSYSAFPPVTNDNAYTGSASIVINYGSYTWTQTANISWTRGSTVYSWDYSTSNTYSNLALAGTDASNTTLTFSGTLTLSNPNTGADMQADGTALLALWPLNDDALHPWRTDGVVNVMPKVSRLGLEKNVSPIGFLPAQVQDMTAPVNDANGYAPFTTNVNPPPFGWTYVSTQAAAWAPTYSYRAWFDPAVYLWQYPAGYDQTNHAATGLIKMVNGSVRGAPNPAGYQGYFDFGFQNWGGCCAPEGAGFIGYQVGWLPSVAAFASGMGAQIPRNCTQCTNCHEILNKPSSGAMMAYNDVNTAPQDPCSGGSLGLTDGAFWMVKWAECGETYQSANFARAAGYDKFSIDQSQPVYCYDGTTLTNSADGSTAADGARSGIWGGQSAGGFYNGFSSTGGTVTLGPKVLNLPSDWSSPSGDTGRVFGQLRFSGVPSLLGRTVIKTDPTDPTGKTFDWATPQTNFAMGMAGTESVDIYDAGMNLLASNVTATRVNDSTFTLGAAYSTALFAMIHDPAPWYQYDTYPKGDYIWLQWLLDNRTPQEFTRINGVRSAQPACCPAAITDNNGYATFNQTADSLPLLKCNPRVVCFSPNGEVFPNGKTYGFPATFSLDERYGSKWQAQVVWSMTDPFWQAPHAPCGLNGTAAWIPDTNGLCPAPGGATDYYELAPMVEARLTVPAGFLALPPGITLGFLSPVTNTVGDVAYPPPPPAIFQNGNPSPVLTPWVLAINLCGVISGGACRFNYGDWVVGC